MVHDFECGAAQQAFLSISVCVIAPPPIRPQNQDQLTHGTRTCTHTAAPPIKQHSMIFFSFFFLLLPSLSPSLPPSLPPSLLLLLLFSFVVAVLAPELGPLDLHQHVGRGVEEDELGGWEGGRRGRAGGREGGRRSGREGESERGRGGRKGVREGRKKEGRKGGREEILPVVGT